MQGFLIHLSNFFIFMIPKVRRAGGREVSWSWGHKDVMSQGHEVTKSLGHKVTRSLGHKVVGSQVLEVTRSWGHEVVRSRLTRMGDHEVTRSWGHEDGRKQGHAVLGSQGHSYLEASRLSWAVGLHPTQLDSQRLVLATHWKTGVNIIPLENRGK